MEAFEFEDFGWLCRPPHPNALVERHRHTSLDPGVHGNYLSYGAGEDVRVLFIKETLFDGIARHAVFVFPYP